MADLSPELRDWIEKTIKWHDSSKAGEKMKTTGEKPCERLYGMNEVMCDLWEIEEKIKALALMFKNFNGGGSMIEHAEHLSGIGFFLTETSQDLNTLIRTQLDGREFHDPDPRK